MVAAARTRRVATAALAALTIAACGTLGGRDALPVQPFLAVAPEFDGTVEVVEYAGSDIGDPAPGWMRSTPLQLEQTEDFANAYVLRFELRGETLSDVRNELRTFPYSARATRAVHDRATEHAADLPGLDDGFADDAARILLAVEYMGARRRGDFWVHELLFDATGTQVGERYRAWVLVSVPRDQVAAGLRLAYDTANTHHPPSNDRQVRTRDELRARFRDWL